MYKITTNAKGSRFMEISDSHLQTIEKYTLFEDLTDSNGIVDEMVLEKLRLTVRALIDAHPEMGDLVEFCREVLFHDNMKAFGLNELMQLYSQVRSELSNGGNEDNA